eukprot:GHVL01013257.1.p1 GENE.GHVL01013257.1~~GHVL01013257.1.p1  ORF type:complete len:552 (+),score=42.05 GHVL01013257.1:22-1677(+)
MINQTSFSSDSRNRETKFQTCAQVTSSFNDAASLVGSKLGEMELKKQESTISFLPPRGMPVSYTQHRSAELWTKVRVAYHMGVFKSSRKLLGTSKRSGADRIIWYSSTIRWKYCNPDNWYILFWDLLQHILRTISIYQIIYLLAFWDGPEHHRSLWWIEIFFLFDIIVQFLKCHKDPKTGQYSTKYGDIAKRYLRSYFFFDVTALIPLWLVGITPFNRLCRLFRIRSVMVFIRRQTVPYNHTGEGGNFIHRILRKISSPDTTNFAGQLFQLSYAIAVTVHVLACVWYMLGVWELSKNKLNWIEEEEIVEASRSFKYGVCVYFIIVTLTTVGFGDITPHSNWEMFYVMLIQLIGVGGFAFIIGSTVRLVVSWSKPESHLVLIQEVSNWLQSWKKQFTVDERSQIIEHYRCGKGSVLDRRNDRVIISPLPPVLRSQLMHQKFTQFLKSFDYLFETLSATLVMRTLFDLSPRGMLSDQQLGEEPLNEILFLMSGTVGVVYEKQIICEFFSGSVVGDLCLVEDPPMDISYVVTSPQLMGYSIDLEKFKVNRYKYG